MSHPPNIAMVAPSLDILGGQAVQAKLLAERLRGEGYEIEWVPIDPPFPSAAAWMKRLRFLRTVANEGLYLPSLGRIRRGDVVHIYSASYWSFLLAPLPAILAARRLRKPIVLNYHSGEAADHLAHWGRLIHPWLKLVDEIVVPSRYLRQVFAAFGYEARVIHNVIDTGQFVFRPRRPLRPAFLSVRNFDLHYGVEQTLVAFALLQNRVPDATLTVAGQGGQEAGLKRLAEALRLRHVRFAGPVPPAAMPALYDAHSMFLNSSFIDNQPLSILEAMASGLPIVTTGVGDISNMIEDGESGTLVPTGDPAAMARAATLLLRQPERALLMARRANDRLARYAWSSVGPEWSDLYRSMAATRVKAAA